MRNRVSSDLFSGTPEHARICARSTPANDNRFSDSYSRGAEFACDIDDLRFD
jgi:hypothetical protein